MPLQVLSKNHLSEKEINNAVDEFLKNGCEAVVTVILDEIYHFTNFNYEVEKFEKFQEIGIFSKFNLAIIVTKNKKVLYGGCFNRGCKQLGFQEFEPRKHENGSYCEHAAKLQEKHGRYKQNLDYRFEKPPVNTLEALFLLSGGATYSISSNPSYRMAAYITASTPKKRHMVLNRFPQSEALLYVNSEFKFLDFISTLQFSNIFLSEICQENCAWYVYFSSIFDGVNEKMSANYGEKKMQEYVSFYKKIIRGLRIQKWAENTRKVVLPEYYARVDNLAMKYTTKRLRARIASHLQ